jgi:hypothetical protein
MLAGEDGWGLALIASKSGQHWVVYIGNVITLTPYVHIFTSRKSLARLSSSVSGLAGMLAGAHHCLRRLSVNVNYSVLKAPPANCSAIAERRVEALCQWLGPSARSAFEEGRLIHH